MTRRRPASSAACSRSMPSWPAATSGGVHHEHGGLVGDKDPKPPPVAVLTVDVFEHLPAGLVGVHMTGLAAVGGDRLRPRRDQRRDLLQRPGQGAGGHIEPVGGQRLDDPVHRPAQHMFLIRQPRQEPGGEQALRHRLGRRRRARRPGPRMRTPPPVAAPPRHDPGDLHLPVDLLAVLGAQELKRLPAFGAAPLAGIQIDEPFLGLQMRTIPPPVTPPARPLSPLPLATGPNPAGAAVVPAPAVPPSGRTALLARGAEQQPAQRRHALLQPVHLPGQLGHLRGQPGPLRPQRSGHRLQLPRTRLGPLRAGTPVTGINIPIDHRRGHTTQPTPPHKSRHAPNPRVSQIPRKSRRGSGREPAPRRPQRRPLPHGAQEGRPGSASSTGGP